MKTSTTGVTGSLLCAAANFSSSCRLIDQASQFSRSSSSSFLESVDTSRFSETDKLDKFDEMIRGGFESSHLAKEFAQEAKSFEMFEKFETIWQTATKETDEAKIDTINEIMELGHELKQSIRARKVARGKPTDAANQVAIDEKEDARIKEILVGLKFLKVKPREVFSLDEGVVKTAGVNWSFTRSNDALLPHAESLAKEIKLLNSLRSPTSFKVEFGKQLDELDETELNALLLADHNFGKSIISIQGCTGDSVRVLTWMRTKAGFCNNGDSNGGNRNWNGKDILASMWHMSQLGADKYLEQTIDLIFNKRYWTCQDDDIKFPLQFVHNIAFWKQRKHVLQWFLERGQYRYPIEQFTLKDRQKFAKLVKSLSERGDAELSVKLASFVDAHSEPFVRSLPPPVPVRSKL